MLKYMDELPPESASSYLPDNLKMGTILFAYEESYDENKDMTFYTLSRFIILDGPSTKYYSLLNVDSNKIHFYAPALYHGIWFEHF